MPWSLRFFIGLTTISLFLYVAVYALIEIKDQIKDLVNLVNEIKSFILEIKNYNKDNDG